MKKRLKWIYMLVGGFLAVGLIAGAGLAFIKSEAAGLHTPSFDTPGPMTGWLAEGDLQQNKYLEALAQALDITVDELQGAFEAVWRAALETAVKDGKLTEDQAAQMLENQGFGIRGRGRPIGVGQANTELLATELGISVEALEAAQAEAHESLLAEAIANGDLTQEQVELMQSHRALAPYLQAAMDEAFENAVDRALSEGAITQAQADLLLEQGRPGMPTEGLPGGPGMRDHGRRFPGGQFFGSEGS